jgi:hypothetical protein
MISAVFQAKGSDNWKLYYIEMAVSRFHQFWETLYNRMLEGTIKNSLAIDSMVSTLGPDPEVEDLDPFAISAASLGVAAGLAAGLPPVAALIGIVGGAMSIAGELQGEEDPVDYNMLASDQLSRVSRDFGSPSPSISVSYISTDIQLQSFISLTSSIKKMLKLGTDGGTEDGATSAELPGRTGSWGTATSGFYDGGRWLLNDAVSDANAIGDNLDKIVKQAMATTILRKDRHFVFIDTGRGEDDCNTAGSVWMPEHEGCAQLWKVMDLGGDTRDPLGYGMANGGSEDLFNAITGDTGGHQDLATTYENAIQCALAYNEAFHHVSADPTTYAFDGSYPECYFNYPVFKGWAFWKGIYQSWEMHGAGNVKIDTVPWDGY